MSLFPSRSEESKRVAMMWRRSPSPPPTRSPSRLSIQRAYHSTAPCPPSPRSAAPRGPRRARTAVAPRSAPAPASRPPTGTERQVHPRLHQGALGRGPRATRRGRRAARRAPAPPAVRALCAWGWARRLSTRARAGRSRSSWRSSPSMAQAASTRARGSHRCVARAISSVQH
jgi:hypothetical protein